MTPVPSRLHKEGTTVPSAEVETLTCHVFLFVSKLEAMSRRFSPLNPSLCHQTSACWLVWFPVWRSSSSRSGIKPMTPTNTPQTLTRKGRNAAKASEAVKDAKAAKTSPPASTSEPTNTLKGGDDGEDKQVDTQAHSIPARHDTPEELQNEPLHSMPNNIEHTVSSPPLEKPANQPEPVPGQSGSFPVNPDGAETIPEEGHDVLIHAAGGAQPQSSVKNASRTEMIKEKTQKKPVPGGENEIPPATKRRLGAEKAVKGHMTSPTITIDLLNGESGEE